MKINTFCVALPQTGTMRCMGAGANADNTRNVPSGFLPGGAAQAGNSVLALSVHMLASGLYEIFTVHADAFWVGCSRLGMR